MSDLKKLFITLIVLMPVFTVAGERANSSSGFIDFNLYPILTSVDTDSVTTINIGAALNNGFSYFSLTNFYNQASEDELSDTVAYYTEQNIRWRVSDNYPIDLTAQLNFRTGDDNDRYRLGFRWRFNNT